MKRMIQLVVACVVVMAATAGQVNAEMITGGLGTGDFVAPTIETFSGAFTQSTTYDYGNGMIHTNLNGQEDYVIKGYGYGLGTETGVSSGIDGDGYFGTRTSPTTFEFAFASGINQFGFYGAEAVSGGGPDGVLDIEFYDYVTNSLIDTIEVTTAGTFAWDQFHGFSSDVLLGRVVFQDSEYMVLDNVYFSTTPVPEPSTYAGLIGITCVSLLGYGWRRKRQQAA